MSASKGQVSLEMIVGLIILLVIAGIVIMLVMNTMNAGNIGKVTGTEAEKYKRDCQSYCDRKDYEQYCTKSFADSLKLAGNTKDIKDWNGDNKNGRLVKDENSVWDFCEDRVYCFLVSRCPDMDMDGCRVYMCQRYMEKYKNVQMASGKLKEIYKSTDSLDECYRQDKENGPKTYYRDLSSADKWYEAGFVGMQWCTGMDSESNGANQNACGDFTCDCMFENKQNCPADCGPSSCSSPQTTITLTNCVYTTSSDSITCDTNCGGTVSGDTTSFVVFDTNGNMSMAMDGNMPIGQITFSGGKVTAKPDVSGLVGSVKLSSLDQGTSSWTVMLSCQSPKGTGSYFNGVTKV